ncbi:MAG: hypothetical protein J7604_26470 [Sporocytophaga sp.]|uniref:hypothetical protein n=1 Tax=Sporocytophaga sp. TaxID=2231183 RepID=UPI001B096DEF|nr:hypothetical protein [Sporocytophaga sp.]MBO9703779.1 hypothetical protein [Sporocytophaga sp.]
MRGKKNPFGKKYQISQIHTYILIYLYQNIPREALDRIEGPPQKTIEQVLLPTLEFEITIDRSTSAPQDANL